MQYRWAVNQLRLRTSTGPELLAHFPQFLANLFLSGREDELSEFFNTSVVGYFENFVDFFLITCQDFH